MTTTHRSRYRLYMGMYGFSCCLAGAEEPPIVVMHLGVTVAAVRHRVRPPTVGYALTAAGTLKPSSCWLGCATTPSPRWPWSAPSTSSRPSWRRHKWHYL